MKKFMVFAMVAVLVVSASAWSENEKEDGLVPSTDLGFARLKLRGLVQAYASSCGSENDAQLTNLHLAPCLTGKSGKWGTELLINFAQLQEDTSKNYLMLANAWYKIDDNWKLRVGRFFAAGGFTTPIAALNETVSYPTCDPTGSFVWGLQAEYNSVNIRNGWSVLADIGGRSVVPFNSSENWKGPELSVRIQKNFDQSWLAGTLQCSEDYQRFAIDAKASLAENLYLRSALYFALNDARTSNLAGAYIFAAWEPVSRVEIHGMIDTWSLQAKSWEETQVSFSKDGKVSVDQVEISSETGYEVNGTLGVRVWLDQKRTTTATVDLVKTLASPITDNDDKPLRVEGRVSFRW